LLFASLTFGFLEDRKKRGKSARPLRESHDDAKIVRRVAESVVAALDAAVATGAAEENNDNDNKTKKKETTTSKVPCATPVVKSACGGHVQHLAAISWKFLVFADDTPNAMVLPDGSVLVHTGLLRLFGCNEAGRRGGGGGRQ
jgi:hypothetical protein